MDLLGLDAEGLEELSDEKYEEVLAELLKYQVADRKENALLYYEMRNPDSIQVHRSTASLIGVGGGNRCLPLEAPVLMADGSWAHLGAICPGDRVMAVDPETGVARPANVVRTYRSGMKPVYRFTASDGGYFEATLDHRVPLYLGSGRKTSKGNPKQARKRELRDYLEPIRRRGRTNPSKRIAALSPRRVEFEGDAKLRIHPYLLGALLGDGSLTGGATPKFHNVDKTVIERVRAHVEETGGELRKYKHGCEFGIAQAPLIRDELHRLGLYGHKDREKFIPKAALRMSAEDRKELAAGLVDTDGTTDWFSSASKRLAQDFASLIRSLGGKATIHERATSSAWGKAWAVYWRLEERLPLSCPRKQAALGARTPDYARRVLRAAEYVGHRSTGDIEVDHPGHCYVTGDWFVVSNSSKTETVLVEMCIRATGIIPLSLRDVWPREKFRGPINCRVVVQGFTTTLENAILPKLQHWKWTGHRTWEEAPDKGHWGWIPKNRLINGEWDKSWRAKTRTLTVLCHHPDTGEYLGQSTIQFFSHDQDPEEFASAQCHFVMLDEPPRLSIFRENQARVMASGGTLCLAMTWPDDPEIPVDWIHDEIYERGQPGPQKDPDIDWFELWTERNDSLDQASIARMAEKWSPEMRAVRLQGKPIRFKNRVHPLFTATERLWCFRCHDVTAPGENGSCVRCEGTDLELFTHASEFEADPRWPTVFLLDPHPRKPHMFSWVQIDTFDDWWQVAEGQVEGDPTDVRQYVDEVEGSLGLRVGLRLMDPNMGGSRWSGAHDGISWQDEFEQAGLRCDLADDSGVGRKRINTLLKPDDRTRRPRIQIHQQRCPVTIQQMQRYVWDDFRASLEKDQKQVPKTKNDDFPTLLKYLANADPTFRFLQVGPQVVRRRRR